MEQIKEILAQVAELPKEEQKELLRQLHDEVYRPAYQAAPLATPHVGV